LKKLNVNVPLFIQILNSNDPEFSQSYRRRNAFRTANTTLTMQKALKKMNDESVSLNICILAILILKVKGPNIKRSGN
jgi:hypothetical protein